MILPVRGLGVPGRGREELIGKGLTGLYIYRKDKKRKKSNKTDKKWLLERKEV